MDIDWSGMLKLVHVALAFGFVTGLIGRGILLRRAERSTDIMLTTAFTKASALL